MPLEVVMSKYYGESERLLGSVFSLANDLPDGGIIFLDEVYVFLFVAYNYLSAMFPFVGYYTVSFLLF